MQPTVDLPEVVFRQIETLAKREGTTPGDLIRRVVEAYVSLSQPSLQRQLDVALPLIPASETGPIQPVTGKDVEELM